MEQLRSLIEKSGKKIRLTYGDDQYSVTYSGISSKIAEPNKKYQFYLVSPGSGTEDYEWYDTINRYCIEKTPDLEHIFSKLVRYIEKQNTRLETQAKSTTQSTTPATPVVPTTSDGSQEDFNMEYYRIKSKLTKLAETSSSNITEYGNVKHLYDQRTVANILIGEFLDCWNATKNTKNMSVELINDNLFSWKIKIYSFQKCDFYDDIVKFKNKTEIDHVEMEIHFHEKLYPNYPPLIKITKPYLMKSLMHRISNSKMTQLNFWTPSRSIKYLINRVKIIIEKWGRIDINGSVNKSSSTAVANMESHLMKLSSLIDSVKDDDEIDKDEDFIKFDFSEQLTKKTTQKSTTAVAKGGEKKLWKAGTGYGHDGASTWNPNEYIKLQNEKDKSISIVITKIVDDLQKINNKSDDFLQMCEVISQSLLPSYIKNQFKNSSLLEMQNRESLFKLYVSLIEVLTSEQSIYLFDIKYDEESLHDVLKKLSKMLASALKMDKENEFMQFTNNLLEVLVFPAFDEYKIAKDLTNSVENKGSIKQLEISGLSVVPDTKKSNRELYPSVMKKYAFDYSQILFTNYRDAYSQMFQKEGASSWTQCQKRLSVEVPSFSQENHLPIDFDASIFLRVDEDNPMIMRALITGPPGTPYDSGCLIFDIYAKSEFPKSPPEVWFMNHGGNRFNPNLYAEGKVCLSILGTWDGSQSEKWNEKTSSLLQILISIQSQILVDEPYFNEPGHERSIGTQNGKSYSESYNANIRLYVLKSAMRDLLVTPSLYPQFENVIINHFKLKKEYIKTLCDKWENIAPDSLKPQYQKVIKEIKDKLNEL